jgi:hypothetical protein
MDRWVSIAWYLPAVTWPAYRRMSRLDRQLMAQSLNKLIKKRNTLTGQPSTDRK